MGAWQRAILAELQEHKVVSLRGETRSETAAIVRAARLLANRGQVVIVALYNEDRGVFCHYAARPGAKANSGEPIECLSVELLNVARVPGGTRATYKGSVRDIAKQMGCSPTTIWRDFRHIKQKAALANGGQP